jgi:hypothetical protein
MAGVRHSFCAMRNVALGGHFVVAAVTDVVFPDSMIRLGRPRLPGTVHTLAQS